MGYLLMAKLVAISALENPPWLGEHLLFCRSQVVLPEGHDFCCNKQEAMCPCQCEIGEQGDLILWSEKSSVAKCGERGFQARGFEIRLRDELPPKERWLSGLPSNLVLIAVVSVIWESSYLVDPASSHMLVSKIKPCMSKYKQVCTVKLRMAH